MTSVIFRSVVLSAIALSTSIAQGPPQAPPQGTPPGSAAAAEQGLPGAPRLNEKQRALVERRLQDRINQVVRQRLALTDDQFSKLRDVASRIEEDRRALRVDEATARFAMRQELLAGDRVNEQRVAELLDRLPRLERRRLELMESEQRELSKFLSASQRARYLGLQDELRRSIQELQKNRAGAQGQDAPAPYLRPGAARRLQRPPPLR